MGTFRSGDAEGYTWGDRHQLTGWAQYSPLVWLSFSGRIAWDKLGEIDGIDPAIMGPVQTANPDLYGGERTSAYFGINLAGQRGWIRNQRLALEYGVPVKEDLNGPQMSSDSQLTLGWQFAYRGY